MWKSIIAIKLENYWKFTSEIEGAYFRLRHIDPPKSPIGWTGQAEPIPNTSFHQFFQIQRLNGLSVYETIKYERPPIFTWRKLGFRQEARTPNDWIIEVEVYTMPSYPLEDAPAINPEASSSKKVTTAQITTQASVILPANPNRKGVKFYSADRVRSVFLDTDNVVSANNALESITPNKPVCVPTILWVGEWYAVSSSGTVSVEVEEYI